MHYGCMLEDALLDALRSNDLTYEAAEQLHGQIGGLVSDLAERDAEIARLRAENAALRTRVATTQLALDNAFTRAERTCDRLGHDDLDDEQFFAGPTPATAAFISAMACLDDYEHAEIAERDRMHEATSLGGGL